MSFFITFDLKKGNIYSKRRLDGNHFTISDVNSNHLFVYGYSGEGLICEGNVMGVVASLGIKGVKGCS